jgi:hypothetical protein
MSLKPISVTFDLNFSNKIRVIEESISDPTTHRMILEGLVDIGYTNALKNLYAENRISKETFRIGVQQLPQHLRSCIDS